MPKYEIMTIVDGTLPENDAEKSAQDLEKILAPVSNLQITKWGLKDLAYKVKKRTRGYYYIFNFDHNDGQLIHEFRRLVLQRKDVLRFLIINIEKDYGYKATVNPKKVTRSKFRAERYQRIKDSIMSAKEKMRKEKDTTPVKLTDI